MDASEKELKKCPFCGGEAEGVREEDWAACKKESCPGHNGGSWYGWNTRLANHPAPPSASEGKLREALEGLLRAVSNWAARIPHADRVEWVYSASADLKLRDAREAAKAALSEQPSQGKETGR